MKFSSESTQPAPTDGNTPPTIAGLEQTRIRTAQREVGKILACIRVVCRTYDVHKCTTGVLVLGRLLVHRVEKTCTQIVLVSLAGVVGVSLNLEECYDRTYAL